MGLVRRPWVAAGRVGMATISGRRTVAMAIIAGCRLEFGVVTRRTRARGTMCLLATTLRGGQAMKVCRLRAIWTGWCAVGKARLDLLNKAAAISIRILRGH
jgi:hypothetical protein